MVKALKPVHEEGAYTEFLRREATRALLDTGPGLSSEEAEAHMDAIKAKHLAQLEEMMRQKARSR